MRFGASIPAVTENGTIYGWDWVGVSTLDAEIEEIHQKIQDGSATDGDLSRLAGIMWVQEVPNLADPRVRILGDELRRRGLRG